MSLGIPEKKVVHLLVREVEQAFKGIDKQKYVLLPCSLTSWCLMLIPRAVWVLSVEQCELV